MGMLESTDQILKGNTEDTCTGPYGQQNPEGESILSFAQAYNLVMANTHFQKKDEHLITYKSGDRCSTVGLDYIITRREKLKNIKDCKVIPRVCAITQHQILVMDYKISLRRMARPRKSKPQIRLWKMKKREEKDAYTLAVMRKTLNNVENLDWQEINRSLWKQQKKSLGKHLEKEHTQRKKLGGGKKILGKQWP